MLRGIQLRVPAGALVALTGTVGSGKSSLLSAMLGEMLPSDGKPAGLAKAAGPAAAAAFRRIAAPQQPGKAGAAGGGGIAPGSSVAYAPQDAFILHGSLR